jgi:hypothetical protein
MGVLLLDHQLLHGGAGELLLPRPWRILGALESITGVLMCGLSASFLFALVIRLVEREARSTGSHRDPAEHGNDPRR